MQTLIARFLGYDDVDSIDSVRTSFGADWAHNGPAWILFGCLALGFLAALFYIRYQPRAKKKNRVVLGFLRGFLLCVLLLILADPILEVSFTLHPKPVLWVLLDGTESMTIEDHLDEETRAHLKDAIDLESLNAEPVAATPGKSVSPKPAGTPESANGKPGEVPVELSRQKLVNAWLSRDDGALITKLPLAGNRIRF